MSETVAVEIFVETSRSAKVELDRNSLGEIRDACQTLIDSGMPLDSRVDIGQWKSATVSATWDDEECNATNCSAVSTRVVDHCQFCEIHDFDDVEDDEEQASA